MPNPFVTCLCLTRGRREWLPKAIDCFLRQSYENRAMLIVADSPLDVQGLVPDDDRISTMISPGNVGAKRNAGCAAAQSGYIAHFDDDDYSAPGRLVLQLAGMLAANKAVSGFSTMKFTDGADWWKYRGQVSALGTSLLYRRDWWAAHRFMEIQSGQDEAFADEAQRAGQLVREKDCDLMYATIHAGNTCNRSLHNSNWAHLPGFQWRDGA